MKVIKTTEMLHPILIKVVDRIQAEVINKYNAPIRLFETGREHERQQAMVYKGATHNLL